MIVLGCWTLSCFFRFAPHGGFSWHYFTFGSAALFGGAPTGGLHIYAHDPQLQIGPLAFIVTQVLRQLGPHQGVFVTEALLTALGLYVLHELTRIALLVRPDLTWRSIPLRATVLVGGAVFLAGWTELAANFTHLDDVLALTLSLLAVRAAVEERPVLVGLFVGLATDSKPWALVFLPIVLTLTFQSWGRAAASALVTVAAAWLPFVIADPNTIATAHYTIRNLPGSALRALGVNTPRTPSWDRMAQLLIGWTLAAASVARRRWPAVILLGVGARIALDPADHGYYTAGVLLGALLWDLTGMKVPIPLWTVTSYAALSAVHALTKDPALLGALRLGLVVAFTAVIVLGPPWRRRVEGEDQPDEGAALPAGGERGPHEGILQRGPLDPQIEDGHAGLGRDGADLLGGAAVDAKQVRSVRCDPDARAPQQAAQPGRLGAAHHH